RVPDPDSVAWSVKRACWPLFGGRCAGIVPVLAHAWQICFACWGATKSRTSCRSAIESTCHATFAANLIASMPLIVPSCLPSLKTLPRLTQAPYTRPGCRPRLVSRKHHWHFPQSTFDKAVSILMHAYRPPLPEARLAARCRRTRIHHNCHTRADGCAGGNRDQQMVSGQAGPEPRTA